LNIKKTNTNFAMQNPYLSPLTTSNPAALLTWPARFPIYYGWVQVVVAALAMLATLPGRTIGLGLITEQLLVDLRIDRETYSEMNFWATLLGASFCFAVGPLLDRFGARVLLTITAVALGAVVWGMSRIADPMWMFVAILLTRGFGQSALSVISISLIGKWFQRRITWAMAIYSVLFYLLFGLAIYLVGTAVTTDGWRSAWCDVAWSLLLGMVPLAALLTRSSPESCSVTPDESAAVINGDGRSYTLVEAMRTPAFWVYALSTSCFGLVISGIALFNEAIFAELGFNTETYHQLLATSALIGMASQFVAGWSSKRWPLHAILAIAMLMYAVSLAWLPQVHARHELWLNTILMGASGGMITVVFFAVWSDTYGRQHLGKIQGAAQALTVFTSALGPWVFAVVHANYGSYRPVLLALAGPVLVLGAAVWRIRIPARPWLKPAE
jgi:MFS family permease